MLYLLDANAGGIQQYIPLVLIMVVFYVFMILPQSRKAKKAKQFLESVKKGDKVVTTGGIHGKIVSINETTFTLETEGSTQFVIEKSGVSAELSLAQQSK